MQADRIAQLLPEVYRRAAVPGSPLAAILTVMDELHDPVERVLSDFPRYIDPQRAPGRFVPFLAHWVDVGRWLEHTPGEGGGDFAAGTGRLRQVVAAAADLSRVRGTADGLRQALEWATGIGGVRIEEAGGARPFHVRVTVPAAAEAYRELVVRIVQQEKPAHVTAEVVFADGVETEPAVPAPAPDGGPTEIPTLPSEPEAPAPPSPSFDGGAAPAAGGGETT